MLELGFKLILICFRVGALNALLLGIVEIVLLIVLKLCYVVL